MKQLILFLFSTAILLANTPYPELYAQLGTPLYEADHVFSKLPKNHSYSSHVDEYHSKQAKALQTSSGGNKEAYFKELRSLSKMHDTIISMVKREMINAIRNNDLDEFISLSNAGLDSLYEQGSFKTLSYEYYLKNREQASSPFLDKKIQSEKGFQKIYGIDMSSGRSISTTSTNKHRLQKRVVLLSRPGCGWCVKAKEFMKAEHITYTEYNVISSSKGKELFKKYEGTGVPMIIIAEEVIRGFSQSSILNAL